MKDAAASNTALFSKTNITAGPTELNPTINNGASPNFSKPVSSDEPEEQVKCALIAEPAHVPDDGKWQSRPKPREFMQQRPVICRAGVMVPLLGSI
jgi:hypothetical protein